MRLEKSWLPMIAGTAVGGILAFAFAALVSMSGGKKPPPVSPVTATTASRPIAAPVDSHPSPPTPDRISDAGKPAPAKPTPTPLPPIAAPDKTPVVPGVELREFKHVMLRPVAFMASPERRVQNLGTQLTWKPDGEIPAGELIRREHSIYLRNTGPLNLIQRLDGSHVLLQDGPCIFRECWRLGVSAEARQLADTRNAFAWDLYHQYRKQNGNLFFSPSSIAEALSMVLAGARGETEAEIHRALKIGKGPADVHATAADLRKLLNQPDRQRGFELLLANRTWGQQGYSIEQPFIATMRQHYGAEMGLAEFARHAAAARQEINAWVSEQTKGLLPDLVTEREVHRVTRLVLVNAVYFFGDWDEPFQKKRTKNEPFFLGNGEQKLVPMMNRWASLPYYRGHGFQAVSIPYGKGQLAMVVLVPDDALGLAELEGTLSRQTVDTLITGMKVHDVELALPRLEMKSRCELEPVLRS